MMHFVCTPRTPVEPTAADIAEWSDAQLIRLACDIWQDDPHTLALVLGRDVTTMREVR